MAHEKFDISRIERLDDKARFDDLDPLVLWKALAAADPAVIVEIGAGTGLFASRFSELAPEAIVYAVDMEPVMVDWMRDKREGVTQGAIVPVLSSETEVPLADGVADAVLMLNLHHELAEPRATYAEAARLLRPGGRVLVADWSPDADQERPPRNIRATSEQLVSVLSDAGFTEVMVHGGLPSHSLVTASRT